MPPLDTSKLIGSLWLSSPAIGCYFLRFFRRIWRAFRAALYPAFVYGYFFLPTFGMTIPPASAATHPATLR